MSRNFVERMKARAEAPKKNPAPVGAVTVEQMRAACVYDDTDVCLALGLRRRFLVRARHESRESWSAVGRHVGMTGAWIIAQNPTVKLEGMKPITTGMADECGGIGGEVVSVEVVAKVANNQRIVCRELVGDKPAVVSVADAGIFHLGDQFDAVDMFGKLTYQQHLNREGY